MPLAPFTGPVRGQLDRDSEADADCEKAGFLRTFVRGGRALSVDTDVLKENQRWQHEGFLLVGRGSRTLSGVKCTGLGVRAELTAELCHLPDAGLRVNDSVSQTSASSSLQ